MTDLKSSVQSHGNRVTEIITFTDGIKKTFHGIDTTSLCQGEFTQFKTDDGRTVYVNVKHILYFEVFGE